MKITLRNIGKIGEATVELNGITIIAGENDTGKSTVSKALFSVFNSLYKINELIDEERGNSIKRILGVISQYPFRNVNKDNLEMRKFIENTKNNLKDSDLFQKEIENLLPKLSKHGIHEKELEEYIKRITEILQVPANEIFKATLLKKIGSEFNGQITNIYFPDKEGQIKLKIKDNLLIISLLNNEITNISGEINLNTEVIYIDDPFVFDGPKEVVSKYHDSVNYLDHKNHLKSKLLYQKTESNVIGEIIAKGKLKNIISIINTICSGEMVQVPRIGFGYKKSSAEAILDIQNISTGLKTFVILKTLLQNGTIEEKGTIVLDEPEIHLHPEWQLLFAELIVLIQKEFNLHILINTHSPYFLNAIEVYAEKHKVLEKCKFYMTENIGEISNIVDVTEEIDKIYAKLGKPLQDLENLRYSDD